MRTPACIALIVSLAASTARADEEPAAREWYGWQVAIADVGAVGLAFVLGNSDAPALLVIGPYALASPLIHLAHGDGGGAAGSLGLHLGLPFAGALVGSWASSGCQSSGFDLCQLEGAGEGLLVGMATATLLDVALLSFQARTPPERRITARAAVTSERVWIGVVGSF